MIFSVKCSNILYIYGGIISAIKSEKGGEALLKKRDYVSVRDVEENIDV